MFEDMSKGSPDMKHLDNMPYYSDELQAEPSAISSPVLLEFNEREDFGRFLVEIFLYVSVLGRAFSYQLGIFRIRHLSGAIILFCGLLCLGIMVIKRQKIPVGFYFALGVNFFANFSQVFAVGQPPIFGDYLRDLLFWMCHLLMACYVVRNDSAARRVAIVFGLMAVVAVLIGGVEVEAMVTRLELEGVGAMFQDANDLGYLSGTVAITLLFFSLTCRKKFKFPYWILALALIAILLQTISRGALFFFCIGAVFFGLAVLFGKGGKLGFVILILLGMFAVGRFAYQVSETKEAYRYRLYQYSNRLEVWYDMGSEMPRTLFFGVGPKEAYTRQTAIPPHNTFFWLHLSYGGPCAWIYLSWIILLCIRGVRMLLSSQVTIRQKLGILGIFSVAMGCQIMSNFGAGNYGVVLGMALTEKYTAPFSKRQVRLRQLELENYFEGEFDSLAYE